MKEGRGGSWSRRRRGQEGEAAKEKEGVARIRKEEREGGTDGGRDGGRDGGKEGRQESHMNYVGNT